MSMLVSIYMLDIVLFISQPFPAPQSSAAYHYPSNFENLSEDIRKTILT